MGHIDSVSEFRKLIDDQGATEHMCRRYLRHDRVIGYLSHYTPDEVVRVSEETRGFSGRSDFCLTVKDQAEGYTRTATYIWELKSPKCALFKREKANKQRMAPSEDLTNAESQLFYYLEEAKSSSMFQTFFQTSSDDIYAGGVIIGRGRFPLGNSIHDEQSIVLCDLARKVRRKSIYYPNRMRLLTWDDIARIMSGPQGI